MTDAPARKAESHSPTQRVFHQGLTAAAAVAWPSVDASHQTLTNLRLLRAALHLGYVVPFRHREDLARALVTGDQPAASPHRIA